MSTPTQNTSFHGVDGLVKSQSAPLPELGPTEVLIKITHTGLCATDLAYIPYGITLGHEGVGIITATGPSVTSLQIGDRVGGGYHRSACGSCKYCLSGRDIWCYNRVIFGEADYGNGTFAQYYIGKEGFVHRIPEAMKSEHAAPLQCAGATTYNALADTIKTHGYGSRVGIVGIGGLGHLAIQFASKMGVAVVVFSTSKGKEEEARGLGADEFYLLDEVDKMKQPVDVLVVAGSKYPDWSKFMVKTVLARDATIVPLAAPHGPMELPAFQMFFEGYHIHSSLVASKGRHDEMLAFAARHGVKPHVETFEMSEEGIKECMEKMKNNKLRYRGVLVAKDA